MSSPTTARQRTRPRRHRPKPAPVVRHRAAAGLGTVGAVCAGLAVLCACQKPTPLVTVVSGRDSVHAQTGCYDDGRQVPVPELEGCLHGRHRTLAVDPDGLVRFGVEPAVADRGWAILLNGRPLSDVSHRTYRTVPAGVFFSRQYGATGETSTASVLEGGGTRFVGLWSFTFRKRA